MSVGLGLRSILRTDRVVALSTSGSPSSLRILAMSSFANIGVTGALATQVLRDALTTGGRRAANDKAKASQDQLRSCAGNASRTMLPESVEATTRRRNGVPRRSASAGPSAPPPRGWTESSGARYGNRDDSLTLFGDPALAELVNRRHGLTRASQPDMRDPWPVESSLGYTEERASRGVTVSGYQWFFALLVIFLGSMVLQTAGSPMSPAQPQRVTMTDQLRLDASPVDYFNHLYLAGCQGSEAEKTVASFCHYVTSSVFNRDLPRDECALQGLQKLARMFVAYTRPSELVNLRVCP